jgi:hypothetical protein
MGIADMGQGTWHVEEDNAQLTLAPTSTIRIHTSYEHERQEEANRG